MSTFQWSDVIYHLLHLAGAYALALPIAYDREKAARSAGLRTFPLVSVACCGFLLTGTSVVSSDGGLARLMMGIMSGLGFLGGGAILKGDEKVKGMATAASIWNTGAIGMAVAFRRYEVAIILCAVNVISLRLGTQIKVMANGDESRE